MTMNPKWPAIREELDNDIAAAMSQGNVRAWILLVRKRVTLGGEVDPLPYVRVSPQFFALLDSCTDPSVAVGCKTVVGVPIELL